MKYQEETSSIPLTCGENKWGFQGTGEDLAKQPVRDNIINDSKAKTTDI